MARPAAPKRPPPQAAKCPDHFYNLRYGKKWNPVLDVKGRPVGPMPNWMIDRSILKNYDRFVGSCPDLPSWEDIFKGWVTWMFGDPEGSFYFEWNPYAERILRAFIDHRLLAIAGHASSSKTETLACIGVSYWLIDPYNTKVLLTSQTARAAKGKIWGSVDECWQQACRKFGGEKNMPGKSVPSRNIIRYEDSGEKGITEKAGLELVVGEQSRAKESAEKIQGYKRGKVLLMADELATLHPSLLDTALTNLKVNNEFRLLGAFNPDSYYDPGGKLSKPKDGWHTITEHSMEWETIIEPLGLKGYCIRFDGEKSPNVLAAKKIWRGLLDIGYLNDLRNAYGPKTKSYWKMVRGFWSPTGSKEAIYTEAEIINHRADAPVTTWLTKPTRCAGMDPAFAHGGDRAALAIAQHGTAVSPDTGKAQKVFELLKIISLDDDITDKTRSKSEWIVDSLKAKLKEYDVHVSNLAIDATGGGDPFSTLVARDIGSGFLNVQFAGSASDKPVSSNNKTPANQRFKNKVSELWMVGIELIRTGQFKGLLPDVISEMTSRTYTENDKAALTEVESKTKMKLRTKKSPDLADAVFLALEIARQRGGLSSNEDAARVPVKAGPSVNPVYEALFGHIVNPPKRPSFNEVEAIPSFAKETGGWDD